MDTGNVKITQQLSNIGSGGINGTEGEKTSWNEASVSALAVAHRPIVPPRANPIAAGHSSRDREELFKKALSDKLNVIDWKNNISLKRPFFW